MNVSGKKGQQTTVFLFCFSWLLMSPSLSPGELSCGDDAFGIVWGCLKTYASALVATVPEGGLDIAACEAKTPWQLLVPRPSAWSPAAAAALPTVYTTVDVAFAELAKLKKGEKATALLKHPSYIGLMSKAVAYHRCSSMLQPVVWDSWPCSMRSDLEQRPQGDRRFVAPCPLALRGLRHSWSGREAPVPARSGSQVHYIIEKWSPPYHVACRGTCRLCRLVGKSRKPEETNLRQR